MSLTSKFLVKAFSNQTSAKFSRFTRVMSSMKETLENKLRDEFHPVHLQVEDVSGGCGQSFTVLIVSDKFKGKPMIQQHRAVNSAVKAELTEIHAFQIKSMTPDKWDQVKSEYGL